MITFQCDKIGCDNKIWFTSYHQGRYENGKPVSGVFISITIDEAKQLAETLPGNFYSGGKTYMLCQKHTQERTVENNKRAELAKIADVEWLNKE